MSKVSSILIVAVIGILILGVSIGIPLFDVKKREVVFEIQGYSLREGYLTWREFDVSKECIIEISFETRGDSNVYLFTQNQFTNYKNTGEDICLDSVKMVEEGKLTYNAQTSGKYYFMVSNKDDSSIFIIAKGEIITPEKVTLIQKITGG